MQQPYKEHLFTPVYLGDSTDMGVNGSWQICLAKEDGSFIALSLKMVDRLLAYKAVVAQFIALNEASVE